MTTKSAALALSEDRGIVRVLVFNRPERLNAWNDQREDQYFDQFEADDDPSVRAIVVTCTGRGFCSCADLGNLAHVGEATEEDLVRSRPPRDFPLSIRKPVIGTVDGVTARLGMVETLYCDFRFGCPATQFMTAFAKRGLIAEYGISWLLPPRMIVHSRAGDLLLSSRMVDATEANRIGLIDHLVEGDVLHAAVSYAGNPAAQCSPQSMATIKTQLARDDERSCPAAVAAAAPLMFAAFHGTDLVEGLSSHHECRVPNFPSLSVRSSHVPV